MDPRSGEASQTVLWELPERRHAMKRVDLPSDSRLCGLNRATEVLAHVWTTLRGKNGRNAYFDRSSCLDRRFISRAVWPLARMSSTPGRQIRASNRLWLCGGVRRETSGPAILPCDDPFIQNRCNGGIVCGVLALNRTALMDDVTARRPEHCPVTAIERQPFDFSLHLNARCLPWPLRSLNLPAFPTIEP